MTGKMLWAGYRRIRTSLGLAFGLILMYGAYNNILGYKLFLAASGFMLLHLFGDCYNDYWDYEEDIRNKRKDKLTTNNFLKRGQIRSISFLILLLGLALLGFTNRYLFLTGAAYSLLLLAYSHPFMRLKKYDLAGYALTESPWLAVPLLLGTFFSIPYHETTLMFSLFFFFQYMYMLCQKDSTDLNDETNLFKRRGWRAASLYCIFFALLSSFALFFISASSMPLAFVWLMSTGVKMKNTGMIYRKKIERDVRGRIVLVEFLVPYLYVGGRLLA